MITIKSRERITKYCNKIIEISIYFVAFYIPISKALIETFISLAILAWLIIKVVNKTNFKKIFYPIPLSKPILFYVLACSASALFSSNVGISFHHLFFKTLEYLLVFYIIVEIADKRILRNALIALFFSVTLVGIDGVSQYFTHFDFLRHRTQVISGRINGPYSTPNDFSNYVVTILPLVASFSFFKFKRLWIKPAVIAIFLILFICLIISATRSAWIAFLLAVPLICLLGNRKLFLLTLLLITIALCLLPFLPDMSKSRVVNFFNYNESEHPSHREFLWKIGLNMFLDRPILGQGLGTFMFNFEKFKPKDYPYNWEIAYAHNCFLQIASETGILGFLSFVFIIIVLFFTSFKLLKIVKGEQFHYYILSGLLTGIFTYLVSSFFDTNLYSLPLAVLFWLLMALTAGINKIITLEKKLVKV